MKIGLDIDGVIIDTERMHSVSAILFSLEHFGEVKIADKNSTHVEEKYDWPQEYKEKWLREVMIKNAKNANFMPGATQIINKLKEMGHEIIIITTRGKFFDEMKYIALEQFEKAKLEFDGYYFNAQDKAKVCIKEKVDIFIDDAYENCINVAKAGIKTLYFRDVNRKKIEEENVAEVNNWGEIYQYIKTSKIP